MRISAALAAELSSLGEMVGIPELTAAVQELLAVYQSAVPSCLALRVISPALEWGNSIGTESSLDTTRTSVQASLRLDLLSGDASADHGQTLVSVVILASRIDAFADFVGGADPVNRQGFRIVRRTVDEDLDPLAGVAEPTAIDLAEEDGVSEEQTILRERVINHAVGVLIARGHSPDGALQILQGAAEVSGGTIVAEARTVVRSTVHSVE